MLYLKIERSSELVYNVGELFSKLTYTDIEPYMQDMLRYNAFTRIYGTPEPEQPVELIGCKTDFGTCTLNNISTSIQILILSKIAIAKNKPICFIAGMLGDNYLVELMHICKDTDLVSLYCPGRILPQVTCPERLVLEENLRKQLKQRK